MKKSIVTILVILIIIITVIFVIGKKTANNVDENDAVYEFYNQYKDDVDSGTEALRESETFNKMNEANQIKEMEKLLKIYENSRIIKKLYYDNENKLFSFIYNSGEIKGTLGGVSLKKWDTMMN